MCCMNETEMSASRTTHNKENCPTYIKECRPCPSGRLILPHQKKGPAGLFWSTTSLPRRNLDVIPRATLKRASWAWLRVYPCRTCTCDRPRRHRHLLPHQPLQLSPQEWHPYARKVDLLGAEEACKSQESPGERLRKCPILYRRSFLVPETPDLERPADAIEFGIEARDQLIAVQDRQCVITPAALLSRLVDLPQVFEIEQLQRPAACGNDIERREQRGFFERGGLERFPLARHLSRSQLLDQRHIV